MWSSLLKRFITCFHVYVVCFSLLATSCSQLSFKKSGPIRERYSMRKPASLAGNICKKFVHVFFRYKTQPPIDLYNEEFFYYFNLDLILGYYRRTIDFETAQEILKRKKLEDIRDYLRAKKITVPENEADFLAFHIRLSEAFGGERVSISDLFDTNSGRNFIEDLAGEVGKLGKTKKINPKTIRTIAQSIFDFSNDNPYGISRVLRTKPSDLQRKMLYQYAFDSVVDHGIQGMTKRFFFFNRSSASELHKKLAKRELTVSAITKTFKVIGNSWKLLFGKGRKNIFFGGKALPDGFIDLVQAKGLRRAFEVFEDQIYRDFKSARRKQLVWVYTSTVFATVWMYYIGSGIYHNFVAPAFYTDDLDIDVTGDEALDFMMRVWQVEMYKKVGIFFEPGSDEYKLAKAQLSKLSSENFAQKYKILSREIKEEDLDKEKLDEEYSIKINIKSAKEYLMSQWQQDQLELYGNYYDKGSIEYKARNAYLNAQYPRDIEKMYNDSISKKRENVDSGMTKKKLVSEIMETWLKIQNSQGGGSIFSDTSTDFKVAKRYYESLSTKKLYYIKSELSDL